MATLKDLVRSIQYDASWGIWAKLIDGKFHADSPARLGQCIFENGRLLDGWAFFADGVQCGELDGWAFFADGVQCGDSFSHWKEAFDSLSNWDEEWNSIIAEWVERLIDEINKSLVSPLEHGI